MHFADIVMILFLQDASQVWLWFVSKFNFYWYDNDEIFLCQGKKDMQAELENKLLIDISFYKN